jgi:dGTPase
MMIDRNYLEEQELKILAPYAMASQRTRGRVYKEDEHAYRTAYQKDRDRVIHTTAFRRLEYKTQVFIITEGDYYRTRLTHTIEVAQIGRTMARALRVNEDLTEAICLAHDLGHGPFGHSGEEILNELMEPWGGFDHNHQGLRIIEKLEERFPDFMGLNLTWEVREGMLKHETEYDKGNAFDYEPDLRGTLEAQIVNLADEIAYTTADLDDGLRSGMITPTQLKKEVELWRLVTRELDIKHNALIADIERHRIIRRLVGKEVTDAVQATDQAIKDRAIQSVADVRNMPHNLVNYSPEFQILHQNLKQFLYKNLYRHWRVMRMANKAQRFIRELFEAFGEDPTILPKDIQVRVEAESLPRVICDYIAGMTDRYALQEHAKLFAPMTNV